MRSNSVAVLIKTCKGRPSILWVLKSIENALKNENYRIYISDEKPLDEWKEQIYEKLSDKDHYIDLHEPGMACGIARNKLVEQMKDEEFVMRMDDDFELGGEFNFEALKAVLNAHDEIGFCSDYERQLGNNKGVNSGSIRPAGGNILISPPNIIKRFHSPFKAFEKINGFRYRKAEFTRNLLLLKREVVEKVKWDEKLIFKGEHLEFMLSIREAGYKGAYTPDSIHYHRDDLSRYKINENHISEAKEYENVNAMKDVFQKKWSCDETKTKYPLSWYFLEGGRRFIATILR